MTTPNMPPIDGPVLLTVRGTTIPSNLDAARSLHNATAGSKEGMEAARSLSDLSHNVYVPVVGATPMSNAKEGELLFIDSWQDPQGLGTFFSQKLVQEQGARMFSEKDASVWMRALGAKTFHVPAPSGKPARYVGLLRAAVKSPEAAIEAFGAMVTASMRIARRRGLLSHDLYVRLGAPNEPIEILGVDLWTNLEGLKEHYGDEAALKGLGDTFAGRPSASVWQQADGFNEW